MKNCILLLLNLMVISIAFSQNENDTTKNIHTYISHQPYPYESEMVFVQGGTFTMGSEEVDSLDYAASPAHQVTLSSFKIGKYEVTQGQWAAVMGSNPSKFQKGDSYPVETISWDDVQAFLTKLNELTGKNYRLPTEAEWEYAARGGTRSKGYIYSGSSAIDDVMWYKDNSSGTTHPVGSKKPNELGIYDMSGNVWEWCSDWFGPYQPLLQTDPTGPETGSRRVLRGGSWVFNTKWNGRVACRDHGNPSYRNNTGDVGFRLVLP